MSLTTSVGSSVGVWEGGPVGASVGVWEGGAITTGSELVISLTEAEARSEEPLATAFALRLEVNAPVAALVATSLDNVSYIVCGSLAPGKSTRLIDTPKVTVALTVCSRLRDEEVHVGGGKSTALVGTLKLSDSTYTSFMISISAAEKVQLGNPPTVV